MKVTDDGYGIWKCDDGFSVFNVAFLGDTIMMYGADIPNQTFVYSGPQTRRHLDDAFPDRKAIFKAAVSHKRGVLNRRQFIADVRALRSAEEVTDRQAEYLAELIRTCNCAPARFASKVTRLGWGHLLGKVTIYEELPALKDSIDLFQEVMRNFPE